MSEPLRFEVKFLGPALDDWRKTFPHLPPGDEVVLQIELGPCVGCGTAPVDGEIGGFDADHVTENGVMFGTHVCRKCMEKGL